MAEGGGMQGGSSKIGMNHHACGVDDALEAGSDLTVQSFLNEGEEVRAGEKRFIQR